MRSASDMAAETASTSTRRMQPDHVWFADDIFGLRSDWLDEFAGHLERAEVRVPFSMQSRCDLMTDKAVDALARAGCEEVWLGAESGSQRVLDAMDKETTVDEIRGARQRLGERGIRACFFIQFGYPGETWDDIEQTIALVARAAARRHRCQRQLSPAGHPLPRDGRARARRADQLAEQRRPGDDVPGHLPDRDLSRAAPQPARRLSISAAARPGCHEPVTPRSTTCRWTPTGARVEARWATLRAREVEQRNPNPTRLRIPLAVATD